MTNKSILIIPIKEYSERIPRKNFLCPFGDGVPLYKHLPMTALLSKVYDRIVIDTDSSEIRKWVESVPGLSAIDRAEGMASNSTNGNDLLRHHVSLFPGYDFYWQGFVTCPRITTDTIRKMDRHLRQGCQSGRAVVRDSVMTVKVLRGFFWSEGGQPINHRPDLMPRSQDLPVIYQECHGLFGVWVKAFLKSRGRVGEKPYFHELTEEESADLDWPEDVAKLAGSGAKKEAEGWGAKGQYTETDSYP